MKIHTTQNLSSLGRMKSTDNNSNIPNEEIRLNYSEQMRLKDSQPKDDTFVGKVSFKGKKEFLKSAEKMAEHYKNTAGKEKKWYDSILTGGVFNKALDLMSHEVFVQAAISAIICCLARPLTIMALPSKDKENNMYASAHSISSGAVGVISSLAISVPFSKGVKHAQKNLLTNLKAEFLKDMFPHIDLKSITDAKGMRKPMSEWLDKTGHKFSTETKNVMMVAKPRPIKSLSEKTLKADFGFDVDMHAIKNKPVSEWVDKNGNKLNLKAKDMFIQINEEGMGKNYFSLGLADKNFLGKTFKDLDVNTIEKEGKRINPLEWKNKDGSQFMPDLLDNVYLSSYKETFESMPLYSGAKRTETMGKKATKYCAYQTNIKDYDGAKVPEKLGTKITQDMLDADASNTILYKLLIWLPDIVTRPVVAASTIALIPVILKEVFHLEKKKKPEENQIQIQNEQNNVAQKDEEKKSGKVAA